MIKYNMGYYMPLSKKIKEDVRLLTILAFDPQYRYPCLDILSLHMGTFVLF